MTEWDCENLEGNVVSHLSLAQKLTQHRRTALFFKADPDYGRRVANELDTGEVERLAHMFPEDQMEASKWPGLPLTVRELRGRWFTSSFLQHSCQAHLGENPWPRSPVPTRNHVQILSHFG